ncbi:MAG: PleD family two-component system response regulator [Sumerlaeia bacterium]
MSPLKYRVMIVDDEPDMRMILRTALSHSFEVFEATNGLDAMIKLEKYQPDVAVLDMMMPIMNGFEMLKKIRAKPDYKNFPVLALSALNSPTDIRESYKSGANLYLTKPFQPERVEKSLGIVLEGVAPRAKTMPIENIEKRENELLEAKKRAKEKEASSGKSLHQEVLEKTHTPLPTAKRKSDSHQDIDSLKPRLLLVDDDEDFLFLARTTLERPFEVVTASNGMDAINKLEFVQPDLILLDGMMPKLSGYQLLDILNQSTEMRTVPILFMSAKGSPRDKQLALSKGAVKYLVKPFSDEVLYNTVLEITSQPGFVIHHKNLAIRDVLYKEGRTRVSGGDMAEAKKRWESNATFNKFLKNQKENV